MHIKEVIQNKLAEIIQTTYQIEDPNETRKVQLEIQQNKSGFEGDFTIVTFPLVKILKKSPDLIAVELGDALFTQADFVESYKVVKGFLNLTIKNDFFLKNFNAVKENFGLIESKNQTVMVEYSSPNTNKPLHLGHIRNNLLGYSVAKILKEDGYNVIKTQIINDRGIHICKSMLAWEKFGNGETPQSTNTKGDKFVGNYYVAFDKELKNQTNIIYEDFRLNKFDKFDTQKKDEVSNLNEKINFLESKKNELINNLNYDEFSTLHPQFEIQLETVIDNELLISSIPTRVIKNIGEEEDLNHVTKQSKLFLMIFKDILEIEGKLEIEKSNLKEICKACSEIMKEAQKMLLDWEKGDETVRNLWAEMNSWVYAGFAETYKRLGVDFDQVQYESNTYLLGKDLIQEGLLKGVLYKKEDGSVWCDLSDEGLDHKLLLRGDGTSVYMTQDLGTAVQRFKENNIQKLIYTVGNEQDYHFDVLFKILKKLGYNWAENLYHLSYGMVELPEGKMKSREGTVVDADDLMQEMYITAKEKAQELGKLENLSDEEKEISYETVGLGALKYFMLKVDPKKKMMFNPAESIDFSGNTGPFIQYTFARIQSLLVKADYQNTTVENYELNDSEKELVMNLSNFKDVISRAAETLSPALIANYIYEIVKTYNSFYQNNPILNQEDENTKNFRLEVSQLTGETIKKGLDLLGIGTVNRM